MRRALASLLALASALADKMAWAGSLSRCLTASATRVWADPAQPA